jgi:hypothetical protein
MEIKKTCQNCRHSSYCGIKKIYDEIQTDCDYWLADYITMEDQLFLAEQLIKAQDLAIKILLKELLEVRKK